MRQAFTTAQLDIIFDAYRDICEQRKIDPLSPEGRGIAAQVLELFTGHESRDELKRKFIH